MTQEEANVKSDLPIARNEDVEFSEEQADMDDLEAQQRAEAANRRAEAADRNV